jgi:two-component system LytT family response regulator
MNVLIIEDEPWIARQIARLLQELRSDATILPIIGSVREALKFFEEYPEPDLILSDIQLSDGISFEIWHHLTQPIPIIFITAFDEYAVRAFDFFSIDYLLKPIDKADLDRALKKVDIISQKFQNKDFVRKVQSLTLIDSNLPQFLDKIWVQHINQVLLIPMPDIACFYKEDLIFTYQINGTRAFTEYRSLDQLELVLDPQQFFRANRKIIIARDHVNGFKTFDGGKLQLITRLDLPVDTHVSKDKASSFKQWLRH